MQTVEYDPLTDETLDFTKMIWKHPNFQISNQKRVNLILDAVVADSKELYGIEKKEFINLMKNYCK